MPIREQLEQLIQQYGTNPEFRAVRQESATRMDLVYSDFVVEVVVPNNVHEWFVTVRGSRDGAVLVKDWMDHYHMDGECRTDLDAEMIGEIESFLKTALGHKLRLSTGKKRSLEAEFGDSWMCILPFRSHVA